MYALWRIAFLFAYLILDCATSSAQNLILTLQDDLNSKLPTGAPFIAKDSTGKVYHGHVVTSPARRLLRRGAMRLVFDEPIVPVTNEGVIRAGNKMRLLKVGGSLVAAKLADDAVDGTIGARKARYVGMAASTALIILQKGGEAKLHKGDTVEVETKHDRAVILETR
jgi:hypothetical protein